jgi:hypothetical protein
MRRNELLAKSGGAVPKPLAAPAKLGIILGLLYLKGLGCS